MKALDVRTVANIVLQVGKEEGLEVTNLHLNKTIFFMHVDCLRDRRKPLVSAKIEAWEYGPVFREVYGQFKKFGRKAITELALRVDYDTGEKVPAMDQIPDADLSYLRQLAIFYLGVPANILVDLSHARGGAWDFVWNNSGVVNAGMEITEQIIREFELPLGQRIRLQ